MTLGTGVDVTSNGLESDGNRSSSVKGIYFKTEDSYHHVEMSADFSLAETWGDPITSYDTDSPIFYLYTSSWIRLTFYKVDGLYNNNKVRIRMHTNTSTHETDYDYTYIPNTFFNIRFEIKNEISSDNIEYMKLYIDNTLVSENYSFNYSGGSQYFNIFAKNAQNSAQRSTDAPYPGITLKNFKLIDKQAELARSLYASVSSDTIVNIPFTSTGEVSAAVHENLNTLTLGNGVNVTSNGLESSGSGTGIGMTIPYSDDNGFTLSADVKLFSDSVGNIFGGSTSRNYWFGLNYNSNKTFNILGLQDNGLAGDVPISDDLIEQWINIKMKIERYNYIKIYINDILFMESVSTGKIIPGPYPNRIVLLSNPGTNPIANNVSTNIYMKNFQMLQSY